MEEAAIVLTDPDLDNTVADIARATKEINSLVGSLNITIIDTIRNNDDTLFVLSPNSIELLSAVDRAFKSKPRYSLEYHPIKMMVNITNEDGEYLGRQPNTIRTLALKRDAFKKLPRPILVSLLYQNLLYGTLTGLIYFIFVVIQL